MAFNYNYETLTIVRDKNAIRNISKEVERLYNSNDVSEDIELWGKRLYSEPRN